MNTEKYTAERDLAFDHEEACSAVERKLREELKWATDPEYIRRLLRDIAVLHGRRLEMVERVAA